MEWRIALPRPWLYKVRLPNPNPTPTLPHAIVIQILEWPNAKGWRGARAGPAVCGPPSASLRLVAGAKPFAWHAFAGPSVSPGVGRWRCQPGARGSPLAGPLGAPLGPVRCWEPRPSVSLLPPVSFLSGRVGGVRARRARYPPLPPSPPRPPTCGPLFPRAGPWEPSPEGQLGSRLSPPPVWPAPLAWVELTCGRA